MAQSAGVQTRTPPRQAAPGSRAHAPGAHAALATLQVADLAAAGLVSGQRVGMMVGGVGPQLGFGGEARRTGGAPRVVAPVFALVLVALQPGQQRGEIAWGGHAEQRG